jgi:hypothetical protein
METPMTRFDEPTTYPQRAKDLFRRSNRRHVIVEKGEHRIVYLPLTIVVLAALLAVWLVAILAAIAVLNGYTITLEPAGEDTPGPPPAEPPAPAAEAPPAGPTDDAAGGQPENGSSEA